MTITDTARRPVATRRLRHIVDPLTDDRWDAFVQQHPAALAFHTSAWCRVLVDAYGYQPRYHVLLDDDGHITAALPLMFVSSRLTGRRLVSLPFCDHCHPLVTTADEAELLVDAAIADAQELGAARIELRGWPNASVAVPSRLTPQHHYHLHELELPADLEDYREHRISKSARNHMRQAIKRGMTVRQGSGPADIRALYALNLMLRRRRGRLPAPLRFFQAIDRYLIRSGQAYLFIGEVQGTVIAAELTLVHRDTSNGLFLVSDHRYWQYRPNHLMAWETIAWAHAHQLRRCDVGRTGPEAAGVSAFKEQWRFVKRDLPYFHFPSREGSRSLASDSGAGRLVATFARFAPDPLLAMAGSYLYGHIG